MNTKLVLNKGFHMQYCWVVERGGVAAKRARMVRRMILLITVLLFDLITSERTTKFQLQNILFEINGKITSEKRVVS